MTSKMAPNFAAFRIFRKDAKVAKLSGRTPIGLAAKRSCEVDSIYKLPKNDRVAQNTREQMSAP